MSPSTTSASSLWYFVPATFFFVGAVFLLTMTEGFVVLAVIAILVGAVIAVAGFIALHRELRGRRG